MAKSFLCPVSAYTHMINLFPGKSTDPAFGLPNRQGGITPLSKHDIDCMLRSFFDMIPLFIHFTVLGEAGPP